MDKLRVDKLRHYTKCHTIKQVVDKWVEIWLPPLRNIEAGKDELHSTILKLFKERMLGLIGSDEVCETHNGKYLELDEYLEPCYIKIRNNLRAELRKKVGE
jgi:hypothetical protein